ncbi:hypothetical protein FOZ63_025940, partial [Perkinsus olseni]
MRRPNDEHHFWQQRIEWERGASKRSSAAASRVAAALSAIKKKEDGQDAIENIRHRGVSLRSAAGLSGDTFRNGGGGALKQQQQHYSLYPTTAHNDVPPSSYYSSSAGSSCYAASSSSTNGSIDLCSSGSIRIDID